MAIILATFGLRELRKKGGKRTAKLKSPPSERSRSKKGSRRRGFWVGIGRGSNGDGRGWGVEEKGETGVALV